MCLNTSVNKAKNHNVGAHQFFNSSTRVHAVQNLPIDPLAPHGALGQPGGSNPLPRSATRAARGAAPPGQETDWAQMGRGGTKRFATPLYVSRVNALPICDLSFDLRRYSISGLTSELIN